MDSLLVRHPRHLRCPLHETVRAGDREGATHSRTDEGLRAFTMLGLRFGRMSVAQSRCILGSTHGSIEVGQPQSRSRKVPIVLTRHNDRETSQVQIQSIEDRCMAQGRGTGDSRQSGEFLLRHPTITLIAS